MTHSLRATAIAVFARAPVPGQCKTRLIPRLGAKGAAQLQEKLILRALETALAAEAGAVELWCAPDCRHPFFAMCAERFGVALRDQQGADLGARMAFVFEQADAPTLLMGTDCPSITPDDLRACADALQACDAVFLPAEDGGYGAVGLKAPAPEIFTSMVWSAPGVMDATRTRLCAAGKSWREVRAIWDVDDPPDYDRLLASGLMKP